MSTAAVNCPLDKRWTAKELRSHLRTLQESVISSKSRAGEAFFCIADATDGRQRLLWARAKGIMLGLSGSIISTAAAFGTVYGFTDSVAAATFSGAATAIASMAYMPGKGLSLIMNQTIRRNDRLRQEFTRRALPDLNSAYTQALEMQDNELKRLAAKNGADWHGITRTLRASSTQ